MADIFQECIIVTNTRWVPEDRETRTLIGRLKENEFTIVYQTESIITFEAPEKFKGTMNVVLFARSYTVYAEFRDGVK